MWTHNLSARNLETGGSWRSLAIQSSPTGEPHDQWEQQKTFDIALWPPNAYAPYKQELTREHCTYKK